MPALSVSILQEQLEERKQRLKDLINEKAKLEFEIRELANTMLLLKTTPLTEEKNEELDGMLEELSTVKPNKTKIEKYGEPIDKMTVYGIHPIIVYKKIAKEVLEAISHMNTESWFQAKTFKAIIIKYHGELASTSINRLTTAYCLLFVRRGNLETKNDDNGKMMFKRTSKAIPDKYDEELMKRAIEMRELQKQG